MPSNGSCSAPRAPLQCESCLMMYMRRGPVFCCCEAGRQCIAPSISVRGLTHILAACVGLWLHWGLLLAWAAYVTPSDTADQSLDQPMPFPTLHLARFAWNFMQKLGLRGAYILIWCSMRWSDGLVCPCTLNIVFCMRRCTACVTIRGPVPVGLLAGVSSQDWHMHGLVHHTIACTWAWGPAC